MARIFQRFLIVIVGANFLFAIVFSSCKKDNKILDAAVQDPNDLLGAKYSDTTTVRAFTTKYDSIASYNDGYKFLGSNQDPVFGRTDVGLYTKMSLPNSITNVSFGDDANLVSAEIILVITELNLKGDVQNALTYDVYQMNANIDATKTYYTNQSALYNANSKLGTFTGTISTYEGLYALRIPIDKAYAEAMLQTPAYLLNNSVFQETYKGLYITASNSNLNPVSAQGIIAKYNLEDVRTGLYLYYQNGTVSSEKETKSFVFPFSGAGVTRFNVVNHQHASGGHSYLNAQLGGDSLLGSEGLFLQGLGGTKIKIQMPYLLNYVKDNPVSINKAEVVFKVDEAIGGSSFAYSAPPKIAILGIDSLGREIYTYDQQSSIDFIRYGGNYNSTTKEYVFNIAREFQILMNGTRKNYGFYIVLADGDRILVSRRDDRAERVVFGGSSNSTLKPQLRLTYVPYTND